MVTKYLEPYCAIDPTAFPASAPAQKIYVVEMVEESIVEFVKVSTGWRIISLTTTDSSPINELGQCIGKLSLVLLVVELSLSLTLKKIAKGGWS